MLQMRPIISCLELVAFAKDHVFNVVETLIFIKKLVVNLSIMQGKSEILFVLSFEKESSEVVKFEV